MDELPVGPLGRRGLDTHALVQPAQVERRLRLVVGSVRRLLAARLGLGHLVPARVDEGTEVKRLVRAAAVGTEVRADEVRLGHAGGGGERLIQAVAGVRVREAGVEQPPERDGAPAEQAGADEADQREQAQAEAEGRQASSRLGLARVERPRLVQGERRRLASRAGGGRGAAGVVVGAVVEQRPLLHLDLVHRRFWLQAVSRCWQGGE